MGIQFHYAASGLARGFLKTASVLFVFTGFAKVLSALGEARILAQHDPIFDFLTNRQLIFVAGAMELSVGALIFSWPKILPRLCLVAWVSTLFLAYRTGLLAIGYHGSCPCLGTVADFTHLSPKAIDLVLKAILGYLLAVSFALLLRARIAPLEPSPAPSS